MANTGRVMNRLIPHQMSGDQVVEVHITVKPKKVVVVAMWASETRGRTMYHIYDRDQLEAKDFIEECPNGEKMVFHWTPDPPVHPEYTRRNIKSGSSTYVPKNTCIGFVVLDALGMRLDIMSTLEDHGQYTSCVGYPNVKVAGGTEWNPSHFMDNSMKRDLGAGIQYFVIQCAFGKDMVSNQLRCQTR